MTNETVHVSPQPSVASSLRDDLTVLGLLVLLCGLISTDTYYSEFGLRYQFLNLSASHLIYRGLTVLLTSPWFILTYAIAAGWLIVEPTLSQRAGFRPLRSTMTFGILALLLISSYLLARRAGQIQAHEDMQNSTSSLPIVRRVSPPINVLDGVKTSLKRPGYRLLLADSGYVYLFEPLGVGEAASTVGIHVKRYKKEDIHVLETEAPRR
jgi:hypothetical protein